MMKRGIEQNVAQSGRAIIKLILTGLLFVGTGVANAASITGEMGLTGGFTASGGTDLSDATIIDLTSVMGTIADGDIGATVGFGTLGAVNNSPFSINPAAPVSNLLQIGGWQVDIGTMSIVDQTVGILTLEGTGTISGHSFDPTPTEWTLSANATGGTYSMTITAVPVPAAVWLFGSGLIGLIAVARRKVD